MLGPWLPRLRSTTALAAVYGCLFASITTVPSYAQENLLGRHAINIQLDAMPAAEVLNVLSERSKAVSQYTQRADDAGLPWELGNAHLLDGLFIKVNFVRTPVSEIVSRVLGCLGFTYKETGSLIEIQKSAQPLSADHCQGVQRVTGPDPGDESGGALAKTYSWQFNSISALEFINVWSSETHQNIWIPYSQTDLLRKITLQVNVSNEPGVEIFEALVGCIGWTYAKTNTGYSISKPVELRSRMQCRGFTVL